MSDGEFYAYVGLVLVGAVVLAVLAALLAAGLLGYAGYMFVAQPDKVLALAQTLRSRWARASGADSTPQAHTGQQAPTALAPGPAGPGGLHPRPHAHPTHAEPTHTEPTPTQPTRTQPTHPVGSRLRQPAYLGHEPGRRSAARPGAGGRHHAPDDVPDEVDEAEEAGPPPDWPPLRPPDPPPQR